MKHIIVAAVLSACGVYAVTAGNDLIARVPVVVPAPTDSVTEEAEIFSEEKNSANDDAYNKSPSFPRAPETSTTPIPALILPNNVCIINTDLSPDRTIEEHIIACIHAHRMRQTIAQ
jgi:hypothetical protein